MRTLVIPDIHHRYSQAQSIIDRVSHDKVVFTGDYFDNYGEGRDGPEHSRKTAIWLKENVLHNPKAVAILGNHDTSYVWPNNFNFRCSGYTQDNSDAINSILSDDDKSNFKVYHIDQGYSLSHAGLTNPIWKILSIRFNKEDYPTKLKFFDTVLGHFVELALQDASRGDSTLLFNSGWDRGGYFQRHGGINWVDWRNFAPISGVNQIVGHSIHRVPHVLIQRKGGAVRQAEITEYYQEELEYKRAGGQYSIVNDPENLSVSYNLDTQSNHYAVIEDGVVNIYDSATDINLKELNDYFIPDNPMNTLS